MSISLSGKVNDLSPSKSTKAAKNSIIDRFLTYILTAKGVFFIFLQVECGAILHRTNLKFEILIWRLLN
jgi:hypothetical protein